MKKLLGWMLIVALLFTACEGKVGPPGKDGKNIEFVVCDFVVQSENWVPVNDELMGNLFEYGFNFPQLTGYIFDEGAVVCYLVQDLGGGIIQTPLPYTFYGELDDVLYSENYTYEISPGHINFIVKISDFDTEVQQPLSCTFRVVLMW